MHLDLDDTVTGARLTSAAFNIKAEAAGLIPAHFGFGSAGEKLPDKTEDSRIRSRIRSRRAADGALIDIDDLVYMLQTFNGCEFAGPLFSMIQLLSQRPVKCVDHQGALSRSGNSGDTNEKAQRKSNIDILKVVFTSTADDERAWSGPTSLSRNRNRDTAGKILTGQ